MEFRILGPIEVWNSRDWVSVPAAKQRALLAILLLRPGWVSEREWLAETLWDGRPPASAARLLPHYVWRLRELLPEEGRRLQTVPAGYVLDVQDSDVDHGQFAALVAEGRDAAKSGEVDRAVDRLTAGLRLWRGPALVDAPRLPMLEEAVWRLDRLRMDAREALAEAQLAGDRLIEAVAGLEDLTRDDPFRERPWALLMLVLYRVGRRPDALAAYQRLWRIWTDQLGTEPSHDLRELHRRTLEDDPALARDQWPFRCDCHHGTGEVREGPVTPGAMSRRPVPVRRPTD